jgi:stage II sporulation protein D
VIRRLVAVTVAVLLALPHTASSATLPVEIESMWLVPRPGSTFTVEGRTYGGTIELRPDAGGLVFVERVDLDAYLGGIREVPSSWEPEALAAQAVAARTYLAWTLQRGRAGDGARYGFDICATQQCQVYAGVAGGSAGPWRDAVARTSGEILLWNGSPAQALYSSSAGPRTRPVNDVWGGEAVPYLTAVDSPEEGVSPHYSWTIDLPVAVVGQVLRAGGYRPGGDVRAVRVEHGGDGDGPASLEVITERGSLSIPATTVRGVFNRWGPRLYPGLLPAHRADGSRLPQAFPSYTFAASLTGGDPPTPMSDFLPPDDRPSGARVILTGHGWGHGVGMSQWGAQAMALDGAGYADILSHYYGGLRPEDASDLLPDIVEVGLGWRIGEIGVDAGGSFALLVNGAEVTVLPAGEWVFRTSLRGISVVPPVGFTQDLRAVLFGRFHPR